MCALHLELKGRRQQVEPPFHYFNRIHKIVTILKTLTTFFSVNLNNIDIYTKRLMPITIDTI